VAEWPLFPACRQHLDQISDEMGIWQHALGRWPNRAFGYCTDDLARGLEVDLLQSRRLGWSAVEHSAHRSLAFLEEAFNTSRGRFRNFRSAEGEWLDEVGSEDAHARALRALGLVVGGAPDRRLGNAAARLFRRALPASQSLAGLRPIAAALLGADAFLEAGPDGEVQSAFERLAARLDDAFFDLPHSWPWPEPAVTYENGLLPQALIVAAIRLEDRAMLARGCRTLDWLAAAQTSQAGRLAPVGNRGWWPRGSSPAQFDQQPIEAASLLMAARAAYIATGAETYRQVAELAYAWFLGDNDISVAVAVPETGGCHDGLCSNGVNANQGAESTLMWLAALEHMCRLRAAVPEGVAAGVTSSQRR
jgi:hypothetical protein